MITKTTHAARPSVQIAGQSFGGGKLFLFAGPCVLETPELVHRLAGELCAIAAARSLPLVFKASFDKANRSSTSAVRGPGIERGLELLAAVKQRWKIPLVTDVHSPEQCAKVAEVVDVLADEVQVAEPVLRPRRRLVPVLAGHDVEPAVAIDVGERGGLAGAGIDRMNLETNVGRPRRADKKKGARDGRPSEVHESHTPF